MSDSQAIALFYEFKEIPEDQPFDTTELLKEIEELVIKFCRKNNCNRLDRTLLIHQVPRMIKNYYKENDWDLEELE